MRKQTILGLSTAGLAASLVFGGFAYNGKSETEAELMQYPAYVQAGYLDSAVSNLRNAESRLHYEPESWNTVIDYDDKGNVSGSHVDYDPPEYPDPGYAKGYLRNALDGMLSAGLAEKDDKTTIDNFPANLIYRPISRPFSMIRDTCKTLTDQNDVTIWDGKNVDDNTFAEQRYTISTMKNDISNVRDERLSKVPQKLLSKKRQYMAGMFASGLVGVVSLFSLLYGMGKSEYDW